MEWALVILFATATLLLILSVIKTRQASKKELREIDMIHISMMEELKQLQKQIRDLELDKEIIAQEAGIQTSTEERVITREVLDLYKRGYSNESIAAKKQLTENEVESLLSPYLITKVERRNVANDC